MPLPSKGLLEIVLVIGQVQITLIIKVLGERNTESIAHVLGEGSRGEMQQQQSFG
jgi:hypothetical protein